MLEQCITSTIIYDTTVMLHWVLFSQGNVQCVSRYMIVLLHTLTHFGIDCLALKLNILFAKLTMLSSIAGRSSVCWTWWRWTWLTSLCSRSDRTSRSSRSNTRGTSSNSSWPPRKVRLSWPDCTAKVPAILSQCIIKAIRYWCQIRKKNSLSDLSHF